MYDGIVSSDINVASPSPSQFDSGCEERGLLWMLKNETSLNALDKCRFRALSETGYWKARASILHIPKLSEKCTWVGCGHPESKIVND